MAKKKYTNKSKEGKNINKKGKRENTKPHFLDAYINKYGLAILLSLMLLIILIVFKEYVFQHSVYMFQGVGSDSLNAYYPRFVHFARYLFEEGIPQWSFYQGMGQNMYPGHFGDPFHVIFYIIGINNIAQSIIYVEIIKFLLTGVLAYKYLRLLNIDKYVALVGGLTAGFLGYLILGSSGWYGHSTNVLLGIFLIFSFESFYKNQKWYYIPIAVFLLAANPFRLFMFSIFLLTYIVTRYFLENEWNWKKLGKILLLTGVFAFIGLLISSVFTIGDLYRMINSPRVSGEVGSFNKLAATPVFSFAASIHNITAIMRLYSNNLLGAGSGYKGWINYLEAPVFYCGILTLILIPQLFAKTDKRNKIIFGAFLMLWVLPIIFPYFRYALNAFMGDYYKHGLSLFVPLVFLILAMYSFSKIRATNYVNNIVLLVTVVTLLVFLYYPYFSKGEFPAGFDPINKELRSTIRNLIIIYGVLLFAINYKALRNLAYIALLVTLIYELGMQTDGTVNDRGHLTKREYLQTGYKDASSDAIKYMKEKDSTFYRVERNYYANYTKHISLNNALAQGYYGTPSYYSFNQPNYIRFLKETGIINQDIEYLTRWAKGLADRPLLQIFGNVKYRIVRGQIQGGYQHLYDSVAAFGDVKLYRNRYYLPLGYTYDSYIPFDTFDTIQNPTVQDVLLLKSCVIEDDLNKKIGDNLKKGEVPTPNYNLQMLEEDIGERRSSHFNISKFTQNEIRGAIDLEQAKILFFSIPFDEGWTAEINGETTELHRANIGFTGLFLSPGRYEIKLKYKVPYLKSGIIVTLIGLAVYITLLIIGKKYRFSSRLKWGD